VLDTGVRTSHSDFRGRVGSGATTIGQSAADDNGHGTHVAGIALGTVHGVAPSAVLHPIKVSVSTSCAVHTCVVPVGCRSVGASGSPLGKTFPSSLDRGFRAGQGPVC
jgi:subtilisin family serine protease